MEEQHAQSTEAMAIAVKVVMENKDKESELVSLSPDTERGTGMTTSLHYHKALEATKSEVQAEIAALCAKVSRKEAQ